MTTWRDQFLKQVQFNDNGKQLDIYEFGVFSGQSIKIFLNNIKESSFNTLWGFDSFEGLPECNAEPLFQDSWAAGGFDSRKLFDKSTPEDASKHIENMIGNPKYKPIIGFYENTLNDDMAKRMKPALIVDIDVDLYSSAYTVLDFVFRNKLYVKGTLLMYDDWGGSIGWETRSSGESRAHAELTKKYGIETVEIFSVGHSFPSVQKVFMIV
jgi:Macrocin-O-methyltransferase (TylF)